MQKQHLEMVQRLLCWRVHYCNIPTEQKCLRQYHILPVDFGTCSFWTAACWESLLSMQPSRERPLASQDMPQMKSNKLESTSPDALLWNMGVALWLPTLEMSDGLESLTAVLFSTWPWYFLSTLHYCIGCSKVFSLKMLANGRLPFYFLVKLALVSNGDAFFFMWKDVVL